MDTLPADSGYPAALDVGYPDRPLNRLTTFFRALTIIPIAIVLSTVSGATQIYSGGGSGGHATVVAVGAGGLLVAGPLLMVLFRHKYPRWWFDWNLELTRFSTRVSVYAAQLDDRYPSTDGQQGVRLDLHYPDVPNELNRWLPLVNWLLATPPLHRAGVPRSCRPGQRRNRLVRDPVHWPLPARAIHFVVGVGRWALRVSAYAFLLTTDRYPPFTLSP